MSASSKGYLCQANDGAWYLCQTPNVKSCCLSKHEDALKLEGDFSNYSTKKPVELINGQIVPIQKGIPYCTLAMVLLGIIILRQTYLKKKKKRQKKLPPLL